MAGLTVLVITDQAYESSSQSPRPIFGDFLTLLGACLYAIANVLQEKILGMQPDFDISCFFDLLHIEIWIIMDVYAERN